MAQFHKRHTQEIQKAGNVRTHVGSRAEVMKDIKNLIQEIDNAQKKYEEYKKQAQID